MILLKKIEPFRSTKTALGGTYSFLLRNAHRGVNPCACGQDREKGKRRSSGRTMEWHDLSYDGKLNHILDNHNKLAVITLQIVILLVFFFMVSRVNAVEPVMEDFRADPPFMSVSVKPNILLILDSSGSRRG